MATKNPIEEPLIIEIQGILDKLKKDYTIYRNKNPIKYMIQYISNFHPPIILMSDDLIYDKYWDAKEFDSKKFNIKSKELLSKLEVIYFRLPFRKNNFKLEQLKELFPNGEIKKNIFSLNGLNIKILENYPLLEIIWQTPDKESYSQYLEITLEILEKIFDFFKKKSILF